MLGRQKTGGKMDVEGIRGRGCRVTAGSDKVDRRDSIGQILIQVFVRGNWHVKKRWTLGIHIWVFAKDDEGQISSLYLKLVKWEQNQKS